VTDIQIQTQYSTGVSRQAIEKALVAAGKDLGHLRPADLALLEDFEDRHHRRRLCVIHAGKGRRALSACRESARATSRRLPSWRPGSRKRPPQVAASGDSSRDARSARAPAARRIADRNQGHGDSQRITRPGRIITIRRAKRCHRADREWRP
jgi:hypothetical protein